MSVKAKSKVKAKTKVKAKSKVKAKVKTKVKEKVKLVNDDTHTYPMTINRLKEMCEEEIEKGNGNMMILISQDDECNGYHPLFWGFGSINGVCDDNGEIDPYYGRLLYGKMNLKNTILLA